MKPECEPNPLKAQYPQSWQIHQGPRSHFSLGGTLVLFVGVADREHAIETVPGDFPAKRGRQASRRLLINGPLKGQFQSVRVRREL